MSLQSIRGLQKGRVLVRVVELQHIGWLQLQVPQFVVYSHFGCRRLHNGFCNFDWCFPCRLNNFWLGFDRNNDGFVDHRNPFNFLFTLDVEIMKPWQLERLRLVLGPVRILLKLALDPAFGLCRCLLIIVIVVAEDIMCRLKLNCLLASWELVARLVQHKLLLRQVGKSPLHSVLEPFGITFAKQLGRRAYRRLWLH